MTLEILYRDNSLIAVNKPPGLLVHRSPIAADAQEFALQIIRDQIGQYVYPAHRIDRKTSGVLLFTLDGDTLRIIRNVFENQQVEKEYLLIARGFTEPSGVIDYPLKKENGAVQDSVTYYETIAQTELDVPFGRHPTSRYSLIKALPKTGRMHQIRKHFSHILHPIIGDRPHGCNKQNRLFKEQWNMTTMMLHASKLKFRHPYENKDVEISAPLHNEFRRMIKMMNWDSFVCEF